MEGHTQVISTELSDAGLIGQGKGGSWMHSIICVSSSCLKVADSLIVDGVLIYLLSQDYNLIGSESGYVHHLTWWNIIV